MINYKKYSIHFLVLLFFVVISLSFYYPILAGKKMIQSDSIQYSGMSAQLKEHRETEKEETYWIDNAFGGMPTYQLGAKYPYDILTPIHKIFRLIPHPAFLLFLYFFSFYFLMVNLKIPIELSVLGALAYGFSTYLLIIIQVGHNTKAQALGYMPLVISGMLLIFNGNYRFGFIISLLSMALNIRANHYQMTYYMLLLILVFILIELFYLIYRQEKIKLFLKKSMLFSLAGFLALGLNATSLLATSEYTKFSTRGQSEISVTPSGEKIEVSSGLDYEYITQFSSGIFETLNIIIPRIKGGATYEEIGNDSNLYSYLLDRGASKSQADGFVKNVPTYWGEQPILEAPPYIGISIVFFAILSLFLKFNRFKLWLVIGCIFSIMLSWGKNFDFLTSLFIDFFPLYNKFRAVSSIQIILELSIPILAIFGVKEFFYDNIISKQKSIVKTLIITLSIFAIVYLNQFSSNFIGPNDTYFTEVFGLDIMKQIELTRIEILNFDILRGVIISLVCFIILYLSQKKIIKYNISLSLIFIVVLFDLIDISNRYIDRDLFRNKLSFSKPFVKTQADNMILNDTTKYRVYEPSIGLNGARTSYFHNSIGGYHGAKPRRFEELYNEFLRKEDKSIIDMLNVKYLLYRDNDNKVDVMENKEAMGNAWFVKNLKYYKNVDSLFNNITKTDFKNTAITSSKKASYLPIEFKVDDSSVIELISYKPNYLKYNYNSKYDSFIVFSEMYYPHGWKAKINGEIVDHYNVNYVLRGLYLSKGQYNIEFIFDPYVVKLGGYVQIFTIFILITLSIFSFYSKKIFK